MSIVLLECGSNVFFYIHCKANFPLGLWGPSTFLSPSVGAMPKTCPLSPGAQRKASQGRESALYSAPMWPPQAHPLPPGIRLERGGTSYASDHRQAWCSTSSKVPLPHTTQTQRKEEEWEAKQVRKYHFLCWGDQFSLRDS